MKDADMESVLMLYETSADNDTENMECSSNADSLEADDASDNLIEMSDLIADNFDTDVTQTAFPLQSILNSLGKPNQQTDMVILPNETLSFCLSHICVCIYQVRQFYKYLGETDRAALVLATLRALELSWYRIESDKTNEVSREEQSALQSIEQKLFDHYRKYIHRLLKPSESTFLKMLYITKVCQCNVNKTCFFNNAVPLPLVAFLLERELKPCEYTDQRKKQARNLCLHMLCHSNKPLCSYDMQWLNSFKNIVSLFLDHLKDLSERNFYLTTLLIHFSNIQDGKALFYLWNNFGSFHWKESQRILLLHC